jgi:hypothetical protein
MLLRTGPGTTANGAEEHPVTLFLVPQIGAVEAFAGICNPIFVPSEERTL